MIKAFYAKENQVVKDLTFEDLKGLKGAVKDGSIQDTVLKNLVGDPEIILFDEPTHALDPESVQEVQEVIARLAESEITMLIVTHDMEFARNVSHRVFFMYDGIIYEDGSPEQIFDAPQKEMIQHNSFNDCSKGIASIRAMPFCHQVFVFTRALSPLLGLDARGQDYMLTNHNRL